jgi:pyruvyl transferase EpsO
MSAMQRLIDVLEPLMGGTRRCVLLDFPHYANVGDSAIWLGEVELLKRLGCAIDVIADINFDGIDELRYAIERNVILLLSGGGNFGDLWPRHQRFREEIVAAFPENRIIQLPQSIHFDSQEELERSRRIFIAHGDFHLMVRDRESMEVGQLFSGARTYLAPDCACCLSLPRRHGTDVCEVDILLLARTDLEALDAPITPGIMNAIRGRRSVRTADWTVRVADWTTEEVFVAQCVYERLQIIDPVKRPWMRPTLEYIVAAAAQRVAENRLQRGLGMIKSARVVVTDRLHAVILSWLVGVPVFFADNSYGKLSRFVECWVAEDDLVFRCETLDEALAKAADYG